MKKFNKLTKNIKSQFVIEVNNDIDHLNKLIKEYNAKTSLAATLLGTGRGKEQILLEIHSYYTDMKNKYPGDEVAKNSEYSDIVISQMFAAIQKEFKKQGLKNPNADSITDFEQSSVVASRKVQNKFDQFLKLDADAVKHYLGDFTSNNEKNYKNKISDFIKGMSTEANSEQMYKDLGQLKEMINRYLVELDLKSGRASILRELVTGINSKMQTFPQISEPSSQVKIKKGSLPDFLANMSPNKVNDLTTILAKGASFSPGELVKLYSAAEEKHPDTSAEAAWFKQILKTHKITFLGGGNSKNFKVTGESGSVMVLKVDNRLDAPKSIEALLAATTLKGTLTTVYADRPAIIKVNGKSESRGLLITDFCKDGDLESHGNSFSKYATSRTQSALRIYSQMGTVLEGIREQKAAFPDMKNTNWLIQDGKLKIADTKSFVPAVGGTIDFNSMEHRWFGLCTTGFMNPPEFNSSGKYDVDKVHAFMLGKNLYQYLSGCKYSYLLDKNDGEKYDFSAEIFKTETGQELQALIKGLIKPEPGQRLSVRSAVETLNAIPQKVELKKECRDLVDKIIKLEASDSERVANSGLQRIGNAKGISELESIKNDLQTAAVEIEVRLIADFKLKCQNVAGRIISIDPVNSVAINKSISEAKDLKSLKSLYDEMNNSYSALYMAMIDANNECKLLLERVCENRASANDTVMDKFRQEMNTKISKASTPEQFGAIKEELNRYKESPDVEKIKKIIADFREGASNIFAIGKNAKAQRIEDALNRIPLEKRDKIFSLEDKSPELVAVRAALASHRHFGKRNDVYYADEKHTEIDAKKAATTYKQLFKSQIEQHKNEKEAIEPKGNDTNPKFGK